MGTLTLWMFKIKTVKNPASILTMIKEACSKMPRAYFYDLI